MTAPGPAAFPAQRILADWWHRFPDDPPKALWFGPLDLAHFEAAFRTRQLIPLNDWQRQLLRRLAEAPRPLADLDAELPLGPARWRSCLDALVRLGVLALSGHAWQLTESGREALQTGSLTASGRERRRLTFAMSETTGHFLPWSLEPGPSDAGLPAARDWLEQALAQPDSWKQRFDFPRELVARDLARDDSPREIWRATTLLQTERFPIVLHLSNTAPPRLRGFSCPDGEHCGESAVFELGEGWSEALPELTTPITLAELHAGWTRTCQAEGFADPPPWYAPPVIDDEGVTLSLAAAERSRWPAQAWIAIPQGRFHRVLPLRDPV